LKAINKAIDKFCQKHRNFGIPRLMLIIIAITAVVYIIGGSGLIDFLSFNVDIILRGQIWRLLTWIFIPLNTGAGISGVFFTAIALYFYYFIGSTLEREWGTAKFTIYYIFGILLNIIYGFGMWVVYHVSVPIIPVYLNLSMFFAFAVLFPDYVIRLFLIIPIKVKLLALVNGIFFIYQIVVGILAGSLFTAFMPLVALLNFFIVCGADLISYLRPIKVRTSQQTINFKKAARQAKRDLADKSYHHKCAVCGKTDTDYPELEFRYCSRCNGYHCFCIDHINNHIHFE